MNALHRRGIIGRKGVYCEGRWLNFRVFTEENRDDSMKCTLEPVDLHRKYTYLHLKYATDPDVES